jgi:DNA-binding MarR family transcriptional regulator
MAKAGQTDDTEQTRIMLGLLDSVEKDGGRSQRHLAAELGIALGLVNAYLKRCVKKGLVKVRTAPARRYAYYLTPKGLAEKSRLTVEYLSYSFSFFRQAKADFALLLDGAANQNRRRLVLAGCSDLAEIATICALESGVEIVAIVDPARGRSHFIGLPVVASFDEVAAPFDAAIVTDLLSPRATYESTAAQLGPERVLLPKILGVRVEEPREVTA